METETDCPPVATITEPHFSFPKTLASLFLILIGIICCEAWLVLERTKEFAAKQNLHVGKALAVIGLSLVAGNILLQLINGNLWQNSRRNPQQNSQQKSRQNSSHALLSERLLWVLPLIAIATFGFLQAALSALLVMVASLAVGLLVFQRFNLLTTSLSLFYALLAGFGLNAYLAWALMHFPVNTGAVYLAVLTAELVIGGRLLLNIAKGFLRDSFSAGTKITLGETLIIGQLLLMLPYYLTPMYGYDELLKHLYIPALVARLGFFPFDTNYTVGLDTSIIPQNIFVISYLLGGEFAQFHPDDIDELGRALGDADDLVVGA